jgi:NADH:ubiquinone oxidoreductase subunit 5 (subunit L)/multisubunit Na+/H+ antiporter MnhA subunit
MTNGIFVAATFLALLVQVGQNDLQTVEIYIVLLFTFGSSLDLVPILRWRFATWFDPKKDPTRWPRAKPQSKVFNFLYILLLMAVLAFQIWYWSTRVAQDSTPGCLSWGFLFSRVPLEERALRWLNLSLLAVLLACLVTLPVIRVLNRCCGCIDTDLEEGSSSGSPSGSSPQPPLALTS